MTKNIKGLISTGVGAIVLTIGFFMFTESIDQGHQGVVYSRSNGVQEHTLNQGLQFVPPWHRVTAYPVSTETVNYPELSLTTKDGKPLTVDITYDYYNNADSLPGIYNKFKGSKPEVIEESWLKARLTDATLAVTSKYTVLEVFQQREEIRAEIQQTFREDVGDDGFIVENVVFGTPVPDEATALAIQAVVDRQQELEALKIEEAKADQEAKNALITSEGKAEAAIAEAEGQAEANRLIEKSLTKEVVEYHTIQKWNGETPKVTGSGTMIQTPADLFNKKE